MGRPFDYAKREQLVEQATEVLARTGVIDTSLRSLATEMGTSARMLVYYFGSKEQLILAVMNGLQEQNVPEPELYATAEELRQWCLDDWQEITRGSQRSRLRILEQVFGAACGQNSPYARYTADTLAQLTRNAQSRMEAIGMPPAVAETRARLALAAIQGLVIEFFTSTDPDRVDDTHRRMVDDLILAPFENEGPRRQRRPPSQPPGRGSATPPPRHQGNAQPRHGGK
jgi:AcrR family transcriptional regulator